MRTSMSGCLAALTLAAGAVLAPGAAAAETTAAAFPTSAFHIKYGATWTKGKITWANRSVRVVGQHRSVSAASDATCRTTWAYALKANRGKIGSFGSDSYACGNIKSHDFTVPADIRGGAAYVRVCLDDKALKDLKCKLIARPA
ncbi:hypothetical protein GT204_09815 [Streptomyces sp. SID4919]|uniref:hypothetical protein n=1 Tax=unclassified Streptomyces TaxID=2593676 RepID=UPI000823A07F|nr:MULTISPECIES: hypothetical protein [unclassified Streptomyces]MYY09194.1 hypothetical protein [Streptomyces sp. SID4919]SCK29747.1 hypothetical protein YW7DRAFT_02351 [Streptomyces sp. AmelKG-E11A]